MLVARACTILRVLKRRSTRPPEGPAMWQITLIIETDDVDELERIIEGVKRVACPLPDDAIAVDHVCPVGWFVITSNMPRKEADNFRDTLNR
jgi:hypothetical protein